MPEEGVIVKNEVDVSEIVMVEVGLLNSDPASFFTTAVKVSVPSLDKSAEIPRKN